MESILSMIANSNQGFEEMAAELTFDEARVFKTKGKGGLIKRDAYKGYQGGVIRYRKRHKGLAVHTKSEHKSHGIGSFCRTHLSHRTCR